MGNVFSIVQQALSPFIPPCVECVTTHYSYVSQLKDKLQALEVKKEELEAKKADVTSRVATEERPHMKQLEQVRVWVSRVDATISEANQLITNSQQEVQKLCIGGFCSRNVVSSYRFGKKVHEQLQHVTTLIERVFEEVVGRVPEEDVVERHVDPTTGLEAKLDEAWSWLMEKEAGMIGIYGMGGVGKTTLLKQIYDKLRSTSKDFVVIWVVVSKDLRLEKIQEEIGKKLCFFDDEHQEWKNKSFDDKAEDIRNELSKKRFVLLLDDLWERIDLTKLGIPPVDKKQSKIVFTTRSQAVCGKMGARSWIQVDPLDREKAWELFRNTLGQRALSAHPEIPSLAQDVANECAGLPLPINAIARSMACKTTPGEWRYAREALRKQAASAKDMRDEVLSLLKFSYDNLPDDTYKSCFLYCSLFPEDCKMSREGLIDYWICEDFWGDEIRDKGYEIVASLIHSCLLIEEKDEEQFFQTYVKMHDLVRDMAIWVACDDGRGKEKFLVQAGRGLKKAPEVKRWEGVKRLSLATNDITELTEVPTCPNLSTLLLAQNPHLDRISDGFFYSMDALTVLDLSETPIEEVPLEISRLVSLQYLNLECTRIKELPPELKNLVKLKCLILGGSPVAPTISIPRYLISSLKLLQVLRTTGVGILVVKDGEDGSLSDAEALAVEELSCLEDLSALTIKIRVHASLGRISSTEKLLHCIQELEIQLEEEDRPESIEVSTLTGMKNLFTLFIHHCDGLEDITMTDNGAKTQVAAAGSSFSQSMITSNHRSFNSLTQVIVMRCPRLRDSTWLALAPSLRFLGVWGCDDMEEIINERKLGEVFGIQTDVNPPFGKLQLLRLVGLDGLESIYGKALPFPSLERIEVFGCGNLKRLPLNSNSAEGCKVVIGGRRDWWERLEWEDEAAKATFQSCFVPGSPWWASGGLIT